jgi:trk system potassium uptake protein TrkH
MFDALCHAFSTVAIGGFSTHDASMAYFNSRTINVIAMVFMFISGVNFSLHFLAWRSKSLTSYLTDSEFRAYAKNILILSLGVVIYLLLTSEYDTAEETIYKGLFQVVSIATTTGFTTADFSAWPSAIPVLLIFASFIGGCAGSTGGGMKVMRCLLLYRQGIREIKRLVHPNAEIPVKLGGKSIPPRIIESVWGFFAVYIVMFVIMMMILMVDGVDQVTAFSAIAASMNNLGPGLGEVAAGYGGLSDLAKWVCVIAMLLGRLEIFTLLVLVSPTFWRP